MARRTAATPRHSSRPPRAPRQRDRARALVASCVFAFLFGLGIYLGSGISVSTFSSSSSATPPRPAADDGLTTASILFVPPIGNQCRKRLLDNSTWHIREGGVVDCGPALFPTSGESVMRWSPVRIDVVRAGFRQH